MCVYIYNYIYILYNIGHIYKYIYIDQEIDGNPPFLSLFQGNRLRSFPTFCPRQVDEHCPGRGTGCVG